MFLYAILAAVLVSAISFIGVFTLFLKRNVVHEIVVFLVALSAGTLIGGAFLHLMPESFEHFEATNSFLLLILGFSMFFFLERIIRWRHCHEETCAVHPVGMMNVIGDGLHNFFDGLLLAAAFSTDISLGFAATLAIILHEIPQELGDFGVLIHAGYSHKKALLLNFASGVTAVIGVIVGFLVGESINSFSMYLLPIAAGGFLHIAASDLIPELHKEKDLKKAIYSFIVFAFGVLLMYLLGKLEF